MVHINTNISKNNNKPIKFVTMNCKGSCSSKWLLLLFLTFLQLASVASGFFIDERHSPGQHEWSYDRQHEWQINHRQCNLHAQSPIDIQRRHVIYNNQLKLHFYNYNQLTRFKIQNAHHTIKLNPISSSHFGVKLDSHAAGIGIIDGSSSSGSIGEFEEDLEPEFEPAAQSGAANQSRSPSTPANNNNRLAGGRLNPSGQIGHLVNGNSLDEQSNHQQRQPHASDLPAYNGAPTIKLGWLDDGNNEYKLQDIHFHWAPRRDNGSEHAIDGRRAAMEMHLVHIKHGLDKSKIGFTSDSVTVIAVLIESYRKSNADFNPIVNALSRINMTHHPQEIEYKSINDLLPNTLTNFYTYSGSLTTPPCFQVVNWVVMSDRLYLNAKQIEMFRNLYAPNSETTTSSVSNNQHHHLSSTSFRDGNSTATNNHQVAAAAAEPVPIMPNIRQIQPLNNRTILASFVPLSRLEQIQAFDSPYSGAASSISLSGGSLFTLSMAHLWALIGAATLAQMWQLARDR